MNRQENADAQLSLLKRQRKAIAARSDLLQFIEFTMPDPEDPNDVERSRYEPKRVHKAIINAVERMVVKQEFTQLILNVPPRHGKTEIATRRLAPWFIGRDPTAEVAVTSYSDDIAQDFGMDVRSVMLSPSYRQVFPMLKFRKGGRSKSNIQFEAGGRCVFVGVCGTLTGRGANLLIVDDPFKDAEEARSKAIRDSKWKWFTEVAMPRRMGRKLVLIIMTRWHSDDIIGRLTDPENPHYSREEAKGWKVINLPALAEYDDALGRKPGEALWPERFPVEFLEQQRRLDPVGFSALYQQQPSLASGAYFDRDDVRYYTPEELPKNLKIYCASDHAVSERARRDYTVFVKVGLDSQGVLWVLDLFRKRVNSAKAVEAMLAMAAGGEHKPLIWWAESENISRAIGPFLRLRMTETGLFFNIREVRPTADKEQRTQSFSALVSVGRVRFPKNAAWTESCINEMMAFPKGAHDDQVDALSLIGLGVQAMSAPSGKWAKDKTEPPKFGTLGWIREWDSWREREHGKYGGF